MPRGPLETWQKPLGLNHPVPGTVFEVAKESLLSLHHFASLHLFSIFINFPFWTFISLSHFSHFHHSQSLQIRFHLTTSQAFIHLLFYLFFFLSTPITFLFYHNHSVVIFYHFPPSKTSPGLFYTNGIWPASITFHHFIFSPPSRFLHSAHFHLTIFYHPLSCHHGSILWAFTTLTLYLSLLFNPFTILPSPRNLHRYLPFIWFDFSSVILHVVKCFIKLLVWYKYARWSSSCACWSSDWSLIACVIVGIHGDGGCLCGLMRNFQSV